MTKAKIDSSARKGEESGKESKKCSTKRSNSITKLNIAVPKPTIKNQLKPPIIKSSSLSKFDCDDLDMDDSCGSGYSDDDGDSQCPKRSKLDSHLSSTEDKKQQHRDRNREHARNTRIRKKEYLEKLTATVDTLSKEREALQREKMGHENLRRETQSTRTQVLMSFFALRSSYERHREMWSLILDESCFYCVVPVTPYRSFPASEVQVSKCQRTIMGIDGMINDTASLHVLVASLVDRTKHINGKIKFAYTIVTDDTVMVNNQMMARWILTSSNAVEMGAKQEIRKQGMLYCRFNSKHKIVGIELMFDVMSFMLQLKTAMGTDAFDVVPNTVQTCQRPFQEPMVMIFAERPYTIVQVNRKWELMTGYSADNVCGKTSILVLQEENSEQEEMTLLMESIRYKRPANSLIINHTKHGQKFWQYIQMFPLSHDSKVTHYVGITTFYTQEEQTP